MFKNFTFVDLFSGVGGFRIPLEKLGGQCVAYSEIDKNAIEVYQQNFNTKNEIFLGDITNVKEIPKAEIAVINNPGLGLRHSQLSDGRCGQKKIFSGSPPFLIN